MFRAQLTPNKLVHRRLEHRNNSLHYERLTNVKGQVQSNSPQKHKHIIRNLKREQLIEGNLQADQFTEIERANRILYEKMLYINQRSKSTRKMPEIRSLNFDQRKKDAVRIVKENAQILQRLKNKTPSYKRSQYEKERKIQEARLKYICQYPYILNSQSSLNVQRTGSISARSSPTKSKPVVSQNPGKITLIRQEQLINDKKFTIQIDKDEKAYYVIAYDLELMEKHTLKLTKEIVNKLVGGVKDYAKILEKLYIDNGDLALLDHNN